MSDKSDHLNMIQSVITRMASNSLQVKCWCITIVSATIILSRSSIIATCVLPVLLFFCLDVRYLSLEKAYRDLYDEVRKKDDSSIDFSMEYKPVSKMKALRSWSIWLFYPPMALLLIAVACANCSW